MASNDAQIDVLLRRYAGQAQGTAATTAHLDADELNAFTEGSLPDGARTRYVSHLADCDDCRKIVSQLAISSGAVLAAEAPRSAAASGYSWWKRLGGFFSPLTLRYAAFAIVLITVAGVMFLIARRPRESNLIAQNESARQNQVDATKSPETSAPASAIKTPSENHDQVKTASPVEPPATGSKPESLKDDQLSAAAPKPQADQPRTAAAQKADEPMIAQTSPYSPPPPTESERVTTQSNEQKESPRLYSSGPRKSEPPADKYKAMNQSRAGEMSRNVLNDNSQRAEANQTIAGNRSGVDEKTAGREADSLSRDRNSNDLRVQSPAQNAVTANRSVAEEAPQTRSVGGRKFRRQGNSWVDTKFKSSMTLKSIARGSSDFNALDAGLRSIAQQLSGEVLIVWKNKAYVIR
jgi:hypothetical protein